MVPVQLPLDETHDWGFADPAMYGHYRTYAIADFERRAAPLRCETIHPRDVLSPGEQARYAIRDSEVLFVCRCP